MDKLILEIGTEEIPPGYIKPALSAMSEMILKKMDDARIAHGEAHVFGSPKKLTVIVDDVASSQKAESTEVMGPPEKVAFAEDGTPKVPAIKFAEKVGLPVDQIVLKETGKGKYLSAVVEEAVGPSIDILASVLPEIIQGIHFPKTMRWADKDITFARPILSFLALLGETVIPFSLGGIESGNVTHGHRFMKPGAIEVKSADLYVDLLRDAKVYVDIAERKEILEDVMRKTVKEAGGILLEDDGLMDAVANILEYPAVSVGHIDDDFMELPSEVLITSMRDHQKNFAVVDEEGGLLPFFAAVNNTEARDPGLVQTGHEKVLRARLADAKFFYEVDLKDSMDDWAENLSGVLFQKKLGTILDKTHRIVKICDYLAGVLNLEGEVKKNLLRGAKLCKTDLVSQMVYEFAELQGIMGRIYAGAAGEEKDVALAIEEHYRPTHSGGALPSSIVGSLVAIADKIDTLCGCFSVGLIPTGASDPYALRRQSIGIMNIMLGSGFDFSLKNLIGFGTGLFGDKIEGDAATVNDAVYKYIKVRFSRMLTEDGFDKDVVAAVTETSIDIVPDVKKRAAALQEMKKEKDFEPLAAAFKRVVNIIRKANLTGDLSVDESLLVDGSEKDLWVAYQATEGSVEKALKGGDFGEALLAIASLKAPVDKFFDDVMVMDKDEAVRNNRLGLLSRISGLFADIADFSKITTV